MIFSSPASNFLQAEQAQRLQVRYLILNAYATGGLILLHAALGLWYADTANTGYFTVVSLGAFFYAWAGQQLVGSPLRMKWYAMGGEFLLIGACVSAQWMLPAGPASAVVFTPLILIVFAFSLNRRRIITLMSFAALIYFGLQALGLKQPTTGLVPPLLTFTLTLGYSTTLLMIQLHRARRRTSGALKSIVESDISLLREEQVLLAQSAELARLNDELERGNKELTLALAREAELTRHLSIDRDNEQQLTNTVHHDLREPLREIVGLSHVVLDRISSVPEGAAVADYLGFAIDGGRRMTKMLDDLLAYTHEDATEPPTPVALNSILTEVQADLHDIISRTGASLTIGAMPTVRGYPTQLAQFFSNLITNALKFSQKGISPFIQISAAPTSSDSGSGITITVADRGIGIPANQVGRIFDLFNRAHHQDGYEGSGVGLALCRRIALTHEAELSVSSTPGEGTSFYLILPAHVLIDSGLASELLAPKTSSALTAQQKPTSGRLSPKLATV